MNKFDDRIYSNYGRHVEDEGVDAEGFQNSHYEPITWRELAEQRAAEIARLQSFALMVADLDRNEGGRHEGDVDGGDPTGISQGNPLMTTGTVIGYSIAGKRRAYVMPERERRHLAEAWVAARAD